MKEIIISNIGYEERKKVLKDIFSDTGFKLKFVDYDEQTKAVMAEGDVDEGDLISIRRFDYQVEFKK